MNTKTLDTLDPEKIERIKKTIEYVIKKIDYFDLVEEKAIPEGLKLIARSVSWIVEQVMVQNIRKYQNELEIEQVTDPPHNLTQYDCIIRYNDDPKKYYVNIKTSLSKTTHESRFDISKAPRLIDFYESESDLALIIAIIKIDIVKNKVILRNAIVFNVAWISDIYYNRANHNLQSSCDGKQMIRSNEEFIGILKEKVKEKGHTKHY